MSLAQQVPTKFYPSHVPTPVDPLALGQRVVAILQTGRRTATYKLATLMALIDHCVEHLPDEPQDSLVVPIKELAERVLEAYWHQVLPFEGDELNSPRSRKS